MVAGQSNRESEPDATMKRDPAEVFREGSRVDAAIQESLRQVRILHKRMGVPLVGSVNGKIISIAPDDIQIDDPSPPAKNGA